jgi:hypothetical protein
MSTINSFRKKSLTFTDKDDLQQIVSFPNIHQQFTMTRYHFTCCSELSDKEKCFIDKENYLHITPALYVNCEQPIVILAQQSIYAFICNKPFLQHATTNPLKGCQIITSFDPLPSETSNTCIGFKLMNTNEHTDIYIEPNTSLDTIFSILSIQFMPTWIKLSTYLI